MTHLIPHSSHWGAFSARVENGKISVVPHPGDPDPSPLLGNIPAAIAHKARIATPMVRRGWLERGPGPDGQRGRDEFVAMEWPEVLDRVAGELKRVYAEHGPGKVFGGSYGWSSAGRFHHAQSQVHRFLNALGGYVRSVNTYSAGAAAVILPRVLGGFEPLVRRNVSWNKVVAHTDMLVAFGGMAIKNSSVSGAAPVPMWRAGRSRRRGGGGANSSPSARCATTCPRKPGPNGCPCALARIPR